MTLLLLAGTAEARRFAQAFDGPLIASLAGATKTPRPLPCPTRSGGFGGAEGLAAYLRAARIAAVLDATHPFAERISANAHEACLATGTPLRHLRRAAWGLTPAYPTLEALIAAVPAGARVLATTGRASGSAWGERPDVQVHLRAIAPPDGLPPNVHGLAMQPGGSLDDEAALLRRLGITHLATRDSGGARPAKLDAAAALGVEVLAQAMPPPPPGETVGTVGEALGWASGLRGG